MIVLLAESKTMASDQAAVDSSFYRSHTPMFEDMADAIMQNMEDMSVEQLAGILGISRQLAVKTRNLAFDFPHKLTGYKALYAFVGEAYKSLDVKTLSQDVLPRCEQCLKIISSVYGILNPSDIIKPYRCEFSKPIAPEDRSPIQYFKQKATVAFVNFVKDNKVADVIDLLPGDADKMIDWKIVRAFTKVHKVVFQTMGPDGKLKTPIAKRLKELRGLMAREIMIQNIKTFEELKSINSDQFIFSPVDSKPLLPVFISE